ncbi:MAG: DNA topoisomerase I [Methylotenera sp. 24-45-7]|jgi:DNA topoisomerase-1|nr:MAG: DNA topoisomerase I [Methylotenera sp. 24-45-7]OZA50946.1 MAG: DNA topoisomerase I [Methylophilales bacterium 39-45-7]HQS38024.1 type I DNA topoisomerase [Methylotenera sp.]HQS43807.1 type I DNA topoisomerase [Methylotenera sp.]
MSKLLIVESPSKAKTLKKYLGSDFEVLASYGHVRDLIPKNGAVDTENQFAMKYDIIERNSKHVDAIAKAVKNADSIYLATDPDREGEAISWHIAEILKSKNLLKNKLMKRVVFHEITKGAVEHAIAEPRDISMPMVNAQQARRALDYLVGFNLSPLLWKKIRRGLSAGRVQSPALRLIVERELEIEAFNSQEYWTIHLDALKHQHSFNAKLVLLNHQKVEQFTVINHDQQADIVGKLLLASAGKTTVTRVEKKQRSRSPAAPFTTSTLQQEAVRKLGFTTSRAMRIAQQLYEGVDVGGGTVGLITYMRTDSFSLAAEAIAQIRDYVKKNFESDYLPKVPVVYKTKSKSAQEAHEAIRPTDISRSPAKVRQFLTDEQFKLYEMIWKRALACQMAPAKFDAVSVDLSVGSDANLFRATGQTLVFPGFIAVYMEGSDDEEEEGESKLPHLETGEVLTVQKIYGDQHFTEPPPRYSEASLVKVLEEYGIGRPSTYASIISTLQDREYVVLDKKRFTPTDVGRVVNKFLTEHFTKYVDYDFTANLENALDSVAEGEREWIPLMDEFWRDFNQQIHNKADVDRPGNEIIDEACPKCGKPLQKQLSRYGSFIGCTGYNDTPKCDYKRSIGGSAAMGADPITIGADKETGKDILLMNGPYGPYLQLGLAVEGDKKKPKRVSIPKEIPLADVNLETAHMLLSLPRDLGLHPETNKKIVANIGRFGPYVNHDAKFKSIPKSMSVFAITPEEAVTLLAQANTGPAPIRSFGNHPTADGQIEIYAGRYGPYVQHAKIRATLPKSVEPESLTLEEALELLSAKAAKEAPAKKAAPKKATAAKTTAAKKTTTTKAKTVAKKTAVKKPAAKKPSVKSSPKKAS